jgi:hypothetical protein
MRQKQTIQSKLKKIRESKIHPPIHNRSPHDRIKLVGILDQMKSTIVLDKATQSFLYPNKRHILELYGNELQKNLPKIYIENPDQSEKSLNESICKQCFANKKYNPKHLPNLFHKYVLELSIPSSDYQYTIVQEPEYLLLALGIEPIIDSIVEPILYDCVPVIKNRVCMIHCYSLKQFNRMFHDYFHILEKVFDIIVCFCLDDPIIRELSPNTVFIKIPNIGMDIASKFIAVHYLQSIGYPYQYIFYIHSKTDDMKRHEYIQPFIKNMSKIVDSMDSMDEHSVGGIFHDSIYYGTEEVDWYQMSNSPPIKDDITWGRNECYLQDIVHYMNLPNNLFFPEGNFYILHKDVADEIYTDKNLYNILNTQESFDYNWVNVFYELNTTYDDAYNQYKDNEYFGNNIQTQLGHRAMADSMIEHMFERIIFSVILKLRRTIEIVSQYKLSKKTQYFSEWINTIDSSYKLPQTIHQELYKKPNLTVIACHTYDDTKIDILLHNIAYFMEFSDRIIVVNSCEFEEKQHEIICEKIRAKYPDVCINHVMTDSQLEQYRNMNLDLRNMTLDEVKYHYEMCGKFERRKVSFTCILYLYYIPNDVLACFSKYVYALKQIDVSGFSKIILTNDSYLIVKPLTAFFDLTCRPDIEMSSLVSSNEIEYHHPDFLRCYDASCIHRLVDFYNEGISKVQGFHDLIHFYEIPSTHIFTERNVLYELPEDYLKNLHFDDEMLSHYLNHHDYPIIKYKKIQYTYYEDTNEIPADFDPDVYKSLHIDLQHMTLEDAAYHFRYMGIKEGRTYKRDQTIIIPEYLCDHLPEWIFE